MTVVGLIIGTLFLNTGKKHFFNAPRNTQGAISFIVALLIFTSTQALPDFLNSKAIFLRERGSNYFKLLPYVIAPTIVIIPLLFILSVHLSYVSYWLIGLKADPQAFFFFILIIFVVLFAANSYVLLASVVFPNFAIAMSLSTAIFAFMFLFSGQFIPRTLIPDYWIWFHYISLFKYPIDAALTNHYTYIDCAVGEVINGTIANCTLTGHQILDYLGIQQIGKGTMIAIIIGFGFFYRALFYLVLRFFHKPTRA